MINDARSTYVRGGRIPLQVGLDRLVLLVEVCQVRYQILHNVCVRERIDLQLSARIGRNTTYQDSVIRSLVP